jgi:hypothetical protein
MRSSNLQLGREYTIRGWLTSVKLPISTTRVNEVIVSTLPSQLRRRRAVSISGQNACGAQRQAETKDE